METKTIYEFEDLVYVMTGTGAVRVYEVGEEGDMIEVTQ